MASEQQGFKMRRLSRGMNAKSSLVIALVLVSYASQESIANTG